jgi:uncharacterized protein YeaO (DUF488 family)
MPLKTKRWNDPTEPDDGYRLLICRYRPRGVTKADETWNAWCSDLGPSRALHADFYGKNGPPIGWEEYRRRYLEEMEMQNELIAELADLVSGGAQITLLCSSACTDAAHCHRTLLRELIERQASRGASGPGVMREADSAIPMPREPRALQEPVPPAEAGASKARRGRRKKAKPQTPI